MDDSLFNVMLQEVSFQCECALMAEQQLKFCVENRIGDQIWYHVQMFLVSTANISKLFWPSQEENESRKPLRDALEVSDDSLLSKRTIRNRFEHYDKQLLTWHKNSARKNIMQKMVGNRSMITGLGNMEIMRIFDPESFEIIFWGKSLSIHECVKEIKEIYQKSNDLLLPPSFRGLHNN